MAGNQMPVLTLDVNEEHLRRLEAIFEKYRNGLMIGPAGTPLKNTFKYRSGRWRPADNHRRRSQSGSQETIFTCAHRWTFKG